MSFIKTIYNQLKIKLNNKNIVLIKGNTQDFIYPKLFNLELKIKENEITENNYLNFSEYLTYFLYTEKYEDIYYFSSSFSNAIVDEGKILIKKNEEDQNKEDDFSSINNNEKSFNEFLDIISSKLNEYLLNSDSNYLHNTAFVVDLSEFIFSDKNQETSLNQISKLLGLFTNFYEQKTENYLKSKIKIIFIIKNDEIFSSLNFKNNEEVQFINVPKPDKLEREKFLKKMSITISYYLEDFQIGNDIFKEAVSITDGLSFREILQYIKVLKYNNSNNQNEIKDFKALHRLIYLNKKESEWEKIDYEKIQKLEYEFKKRIQGQDEAIKAIKETLIRSFVGLQGITQSTEYQNKPRGILFLAGPTGTGKTEIVKTLSQFIFGDEKKIIRFDMSEYNHEESDQKLIGAAPGYVGYEAGGQLTNAILEKPFSILLFDEIEKANGKILDKFLQILEDGRLTSSKGELVDFSETFIVFTSNIGSDTFKDLKNKVDIRNHFKKEVINYFSNNLKRPEILNRIGIKNIIPFNPILKSDKEICKNILKNKLDKIFKFILENKNINISKSSDEDENQIFNKIIDYYDYSLGGRGLITSLESYFIDPLSNYLFENHLKIQNILKSKKDAIVNIKYSIKIVSGNKELKFEIQ